MTLRHTVTSCVLGDLTLVADGERLAGIHLEGQKHLPTALGTHVAPGSDALLHAAAEQIEEYLGGGRRAFDLPLLPAAGPFEESVREALNAIPYGATTTYGAIAADLGEPRLAQAVGQAVGHNPFLLVVPCHRVLGAGGRLTGYAGGVDRKSYLLDLEQHAIGATVLPPTAPAMWEAQRLAAAEHTQERDDARGPLPAPAPEDAAPPIDPDGLGEDPTGDEPAAL